MRLHLFYCVLSAALIVGQGAVAAPPRGNLGLTVRQGVLMKEGQPYHGIGANYFSLFSRLLKNPADRSGLENLPRLSNAGIPFVRFMCGGFWPVEMKLYLEDKPEYFRRLDQVVHAAEAARIGLIPSLFWYLPTVPDIAGESLDQLGNPASKSIAFIQRYTEDVVGRYKDSPAIWGWELGNEYNLDIDLPNHRDHRPRVVPSLGTAKERTERDELKFEQLHLAMVTFATTVRRLDPHRIILTGHAIPRTSAYHNWKQKSWTADSRAQFAQILRRDNPDPFDTITIHTYPEQSARYAGPATTIDGMIQAAAQEAAAAGKPLFIGEFGAPAQLADNQRPVFEQFLAAIEKHHIPLAAFWVFDLPSQKADWNVDLNNPKAFMIDLVAKTNARRQTP